MAWTTPVDQTTGTLITASIYNTQIIDNLLYLHGDAGDTSLNSGLIVGGCVLNQSGEIDLTRTASGAAVAISVSGDTFPRLSIHGDSSLNFGPGNVAADTILARASAGVLALGSSTLGNDLDVFANSSSSSILRSFVTTDAFARLLVTGGGSLSWGTGSGVQDTTLSRVQPSILSVANKTVEAYATTSGGAGTWTPSLNNGLVQRYNMTATGTLTIGSPGTPSTGTTAILVLIINNASGGTITLSWNAIFSPVSTGAAPSTGNGMSIIFVYNPAISKWTQAATALVNIGAM